MKYRPVRDLDGAEPAVTIAIALKVRDGIVLAADSATTLSSGTSIHNVYNHAN